MPPIRAVVCRYDEEGKYPFGTNLGIRLHKHNELLSTVRKGFSFAADARVRSTRGTPGSTGLPRK